MSAATKTHQSRSINPSERVIVRQSPSITPHSRLFCFILYDIFFSNRTLQSRGWWLSVLFGRFRIEILILKSATLTGGFRGFLHSFQANYCVCRIWGSPGGGHEEFCRLGYEPCTPLEVSRLFGVMCRLHLLGRRISQAISTCYYDVLLFGWFILRPWRLRLRVPPKRQLTFNGLHGVIFQKTSNSWVRPPIKLLLFQFYYWLISLMEQVLFEKLIVVQLAKKFQAFYGTQRLFPYWQ
jgi:hypothetical protein